MSSVDPISLPADAVVRPVDLPRISAAVRELLIGLGEDPDRDGLAVGGMIPDLTEAAFLAKFGIPGGLQEVFQDIFLVRKGRSHPFPNTFIYVRGEWFGEERLDFHTLRP